MPVVRGHRSTYLSHTFFGCLDGCLGQSLGIIHRLICGCEFIAPNFILQHLKRPPQLPRFDDKYVSSLLLSVR